MRRRHHARRLHEAPLDGRFGPEDVEAGAAHVAALDGVGERGFVDELAPGRVHDPHAGLASGEARRVEEALRRGRGRHVQRDVVGPGAELVDRQQRDAQVGGDVRGDERVVGDDLHAEGAGPLADLLPDTSESHDAERLAAQLGAGEAALLPALLLHGRIGGGHRAREGEHEREGVLRDADAVGARGVHDDDPAGAGFVEVDVVDAGAGARDDAQARSGGDHLAVDRGRAPHDQAVGVGEGGEQRGLRSAGAGIDGPPGDLTQEVGGGRREIIGDHDLHDGNRLRDE